MNTTKIKATTKAGQRIIWEFNNIYSGGIYDAYDRPSRRKVHAYEEIRDRAKQTSGYNFDLRVVGKSSHFFSTIYSVKNDDGTTSIIKDTANNIYEVII